MVGKKDPTTQSNYQDISIRHIELKWHVDFKSQTIQGVATLQLVAHRDNVTEVVLDTSHLHIKGVQVAGQVNDYTLGPHHPVMGRPLSIALPQTVSTGKEVTVEVEYSTTKESVALQWLEPPQTFGKKYPYLFSQCQPIYARTLVPLQDTPSVKQTYTASVVSPFPVVLSAIRQMPPSTGPVHDGKEIGLDLVAYTYDQPIPIPSYLIAIAAGNLRYRSFPVKGRSWTSGVWSEPEVVDASYDEFSEDTVRFLSAAEDTIAPYRFKVYDLLVLPPSFPYGGMENACLTFLTPTLLTGDRSLTDVVVHELTHSYFGNGVTHTDASSFFLNEGWTTYVERLLQKVLKTPAERGFAFMIGQRALLEALEAYEDHPKYRRLVIDFDHGEDPDDAFSSIPYEKGANLILHIEQTLGGLDVFLPYIKEYVNMFTGKSISYVQWKDHLYDYYRAKHPEKVKLLDSIDWQAWFFGEGTELPVKMEYDTTLAAQAYDLATKWDASRDEDAASLKFTSEDIANFSPNQMMAFLQKLRDSESLPLMHIRRLGQIYALDSSTNCEIRSRWYAIALASEAGKEYTKAAAEWLIDPRTGLKGRMKYCRPTFRSIYERDSELAKKTFKEHASEFHPIARRLIEKDLGLVA